MKNYLCNTYMKKETERERERNPLNRFINTHLLIVIII